MIEFIRGIRMPLRTTWMSASARTASNRAGNFPSRSRISNRTKLPASSRSITRFFAAWATHAAVGWAVAPRTRMRRLLCSMTASTYRRWTLREGTSRPACTIQAAQRFCVPAYVE